MFLGDERNFISFANSSDEIENQALAHLTLSSAPPALRLLTLKRARKVRRHFFNLKTVRAASVGKPTAFEITC